MRLQDIYSHQRHLAAAFVQLYGTFMNKNEIRIEDELLDFRGRFPDFVCLKKKHTTYECQTQHFVFY